MLLGEWFCKSLKIGAYYVFVSHFVSKWLNTVHASVVLSKLVHSFHAIGSVNVQILSCMSIRVCEHSVNA